MRGIETILVAAALVSVSSSVEAAVRHRIDIPAGRLADSLIALGRQAGISIGVTDPVLARRRVAAVRGTLTATEALRRLLARSGARLVVIDSNTYRVVADPAPSRRRSGPPPSPPPRAVVRPLGPSPYQLPAEEIIITAPKRPVPLASFPGTARIIHDNDVAIGNTLQGSDAIVSRLPGLNSTHLGSGRNKLFIRGIADSSFTGPTQSTVSQYLGETRLNYNAPDPDLRFFDIGRAEILSGPQGTLYGSGSLGGIIRLVPNPPALDDIQASLSVGLSATAHGDEGADTAVMINLPLTHDRVGVRLVGYGQKEGGYIDDLRRNRDDVNRTGVIGGRAALRASTGPWTIDSSLTAQTIDGNDAQYADADSPPLTRRSGVREDYGSQFVLADLVVTRDSGPWRWVSAAGFVRHRLEERFEWFRASTLQQVLEQTTRTTLLSLESRMSRQHQDETGWLIGASLIQNRADQDRGLGPRGAPQPVAAVANDVFEVALFGESTLRLSDRVTGTAGARLAYSRTSASSEDAPPTILPPAKPLGIAHHDSLVFLPSASVSVRAAPNLFLYGRYQRASRPGGVALAGSQVRQFRPDRVSALEGGARFRASRLDADAAIAITQWDDIQADVVDFVGSPTTANIGDGRIVALDINVAWRPARRLEFEAGAVINHSSLANPQPGITSEPGSPLPNVARVNARFGAAWSPFVSAFTDLRFSAAARYVGKSRLGIGGVLGAEQGDWLDISLGARAKRGPHILTFALSNALDSVGNRFALGSPYTISELRQIVPLRPRTVRIGWQMQF